MATNRFAILNDYPAEGPEVPEREKVHRSKNKHESGTGRRDNNKRQGQGQSNWGNPLQESVRASNEGGAPQEEGEAGENTEETTTQPTPYVPASSIFEDSDDENEVAPTKPAQKQIQVPSEFADMVVKREGYDYNVHDSEDEAPENEYEIDFKSAPQVRREQQEQRFNSHRGGRPMRGPRRGRGGPRKDGEYRPRPDGEYRPRPDGEKPQERRGGPRREEGEQTKPRGRGGPQKNRDQRPSGVQHQRYNYGGNRNGGNRSGVNLNINQFPTLPN